MHTPSWVAGGLAGGGPTDLHPLALAHGDLLDSHRQAPSLWGRGFLLDPAHLPLTSTVPMETGEEASTGDRGAGQTLTPGFLASCSLTSTSH